MNNNAIPVELLAPARSADIAIEAIKHGADAVYIGADHHGARAMATNSVADIASVVDFAHQFNAKVYCTVNTIIYEHEIKSVERLIKQLYDIGVDALIVQDMGILRMDIPPIDLHASTQCDIRTVEKAKFLESLGFSQLVLARELTLQETRKISQSVSVPIEAFVHGALCVSYSGRCNVSSVRSDRSANRGDCSQMCRYSFDLEDGDGNILLHDKHLLSLKDLNRSHQLGDMLQAGVTSFKIEGRLKDLDYVKTVVSYYRRELDSVIELSAGRYKRASIGTSAITFEPVLEKSFNRGFTDYFGSSRKPKGEYRSMANLFTPKSTGEVIGKVVNGQGNILVVDTKLQLANGDGISFINSSGEYQGVRVNRVQGEKLFLQQPVKVDKGQTVYRTYDKQSSDVLNRPTAKRTIGLNMQLRFEEEKLRLLLSDEAGIQSLTSIDVRVLERANSDQTDNQIKQLSKLGATVFSPKNISVLGQWFIPSSALAQLRREAIARHEQVRKESYQRPIRRQESADAKPHSFVLDCHDNVSNSLARRLYYSHGVQQIEDAVEINPAVSKNGITVMHTRYCIRRELGECMLEVTKGRKYPNELYLRSGHLRMKVECDCKACEMRLVLAQE